MKINIVILNIIKDFINIELFLTLSQYIVILNISDYMNI